MTDLTFSRSYLKALSAIRKNQLLDQVINGFIIDLQNAAVSGETSYLFNLHDFHEKQKARIQKQLAINQMSEHIVSNKGQKYRMPIPVCLSNDDLISAFQKKFPECTVVYDTYWIDSVSNPYLKNTVAIIIDWS